MNLKWLASAFVCTGLVYCGGGSGGSGVSSNKTIGSLSEAEAADLCEYIASLQPPPRTIDCGDGLTFEFGTDPDELDDQIAECTAAISGLDSCNATVGQAQDCAEESAGLTDQEICDLINDETPDPPSAACAALDDATCEEEEPV